MICLTIRIPSAFTIILDVIFFLVADTGLLITFNIACFLLLKSLSVLQEDNALQSG